MPEIMRIPPFIEQPDSIGESPRLQCVLARLGLASRRHCAGIIAGGAVSVNGTIVREPGYRLENPDQAVICVNGKQVFPAKKTQQTRTVILNKPRGLLCTADESNGKSIFSCLRQFHERLFSAGRLDRDSDGLLILSTDGALVDRLTHPRYGHTKLYAVQVCGIFDETSLRQLQEPMRLEDGYQTKPVRVEYVQRLHDGEFGPRHRLHFTLREGRNRQIRQMCAQVGLRVESLTRIALNALELPTDLKSGQARDLTEKEMALLQKTDPAPLRPWRLSNSAFFRKTGTPPWEADPSAFSNPPRPKGMRGDECFEAKPPARRSHAPRAERKPECTDNTRGRHKNAGPYAPKFAVPPRANGRPRRKQRPS